MKRISCAILIVCILGVLGPTRASVRAQNSSTSEHSVGEIIDWIIKNAVLNSRYDKDGSGMSEETGVFRQPEACTLAIQTIKSSRTPSTRGHYGGKTVAIYLVPLGKLNPTSIQVAPFPDGNNLFSVMLSTTNNELVASEKIMMTYSHDDGTENTDEFNGGFKSIRFLISTEQMAERIAHAFKDLITQCGGKPDVKNIY